MPEKKEYVKLWLSYRAYFDQYSAEQVGNIIFAMLDYKESGIEPKFDGYERFIWPAIRRDIDEANEAQEKQAAANQANGNKGGRHGQKTRTRSRTRDKGQYWEKRAHALYPAHPRGGSGLRV